jgi:hypothetical protein
MPPLRYDGCSLTYFKFTLRVAVSARCSAPAGSGITKETRSMKAIAAAALFLMMLAGTASADPEKAYQGGKALSDSVTGNKTKVDDRGFQEKAGDYVKQKGAEAGGAKQPTPSPSPSSSSDKSDKPK